MKAVGDPAEVITAYLDAVAKKDAGAVERTFHPDVEYTVNAPVSPECAAALPWLGTYNGRDALQAFLDQLHSNLEIIEFGPFTVVNEGQKGAVFGTFRLRAIRSAREAVIPFAAYFEMRDGLIGKYHFVENSFDVARAVVPSISIETFTSSEAGSWSNAYLISHGNKAVLFDACMLRSDAVKMADAIERTGKTLEAIVISHAHPDHFLALDVLEKRFPQASITSTSSVVADFRSDAMSMFSLLQDKLGPEAPEHLVIPQELTEPVVWLDDVPLKIIEFGESESKHIAAIHIAGERALLCADLIYNGAHLYLSERHLSGWMQQLDALESFVRLHQIAIVYPGHGAPGGLELIAKTRAYLRDFESAIALRDGKAAEDYMTSKYPDYHVKPSLTAFSIPAYFPSGPSTNSG